MIEYLDLSKKNYTCTEHITKVDFSEKRYDASKQCHTIDKEGWFELELKAEATASLIFEWAGKADNAVTVTCNGYEMGNDYPLKTDEVFCSYRFSLPPIAVKSGTNRLRVTLTAGTRLFIKGVKLFDKSSVKLNVNWMSRLKDSLSLGDVNIPGTHDTAAINTCIGTPYACHDTPLLAQLEGGIRLLDVRIKIKKSMLRRKFYFVTCHDTVGTTFNLNEYQSLESCFKTIKSFLEKNDKETVLVSLRVDDWNGFDKKQEDIKNALDALEKFLKDYPVYTGRTALPTLKDVRGKIFLLNRINDQKRFGATIGWNDKTEGMEGNGSFRFYVQDKYAGLGTTGSEKEKTDLFWNAVLKKRSYPAVLNFASGTWFGVTGVYIGDKILNKFGETAASGRPAKIGWALFDYEFTEYWINDPGKKYVNIVEFWIDSNFGYSDFAKPFKVTKK